jgi:hypothetical protein
MGFRELFKVRKPGNGDAFQKKAEAATRAKISITSKSGTPNGGDKKGVSR